MQNVGKMWWFIKENFNLLLTQRQKRVKNIKHLRINELKLKFLGEKPKNSPILWKEKKI